MKACALILRTRKNTFSRSGTSAKHAGWKAIQERVRHASMIATRDMIHTFSRWQPASSAIVSQSDASSSSPII